MEQERALRVLEFTKIRERLSVHALTDMGKEKCLALKPYNDFSDVLHALDETEEACVLLSYLGGQPLSGFPDVREQVALAQKGACLSPRALLDVAVCLRAARTAQSALVRDREDTPILTGMASRITTLDGLENDISAAILSEEEIADRASAELFQIRRQIRSANERMREKLNQMIRSSSFSKNLQDSIITMRGDRYCIPVKAECRANVPGLVHDQSATGATLFIEPMFVVELGNDLKQLRAREQQEIARILQALSDQIAPHAESMLLNIELLAHLDFAFAKGLLAREMHACLPKMNARGYIKIVRGRHPLIDPDKVVPSDLWLGDGFTTLIITGPNTGGKTVTLKTVGLFTLMAQSGLQVPAALGTELSVFRRVYADIGDEQSIEQSLSTFSSHMTNIVDIMSGVCENDLVLFDELGAGTDPTEGAALAQTLLQSLLDLKIRTMATTHYSELKAFALSTPGVENASVEFDVESLRPTYRLSIGIPGKSNAFEISRKLGLPERLIDGAKALLSKEDIRFEDVIANAEYHRQIAERERQIAEEARKETVHLRDEAEKLRREIEQSKEKSLRKAKDEARRILENARRESDGIIRELKAMKKQAQTPEHEVQRLKKRMEDGIDALSEGLGEKSQTNFTPPKSVRPGDSVEIVHLGTRGTVLAPADRNGEVQLQAGILKMKAHISQLRLVEAEKPAQSRVLNKTSSARPAVPMEVDVRGMNLEEALNAVDTYLADATLAGLNEVSVIHGKGTGVLRAGIQRHLKTHMNVKKYRDGMYGEGEQGVTIVTLK
ncbi:MAG: endonuclease MutS2 [Clostridiales bacterium]|nr:endonuclease MutS2 [Clostridiales bacterium]MDO4349140.1 endonuclease MutS2 [Eubacteriales bacterium]MDY4007873.1 endonuclease MutS2 [Candidatus Limiplasma sp.]